MRKKSLFAVGLAITIAFSLFGLRAQDEAKDAAIKRWEHLALETTPDKATRDPDLSRKIVSLGDNGWELVTVLNFSRDGTTTRTVYYFKKPK